MRKLKNANNNKCALDNNGNSSWVNYTDSDIQTPYNKSNSENQSKEGTEQMKVIVTGIQYNPYGKTLFCVEKNDTETEYYAGKRVITAYCKDTVEVNINDEKHAKYYPKTKKWYIFK
jgi:hypothetical protein